MIAVYVPKAVWPSYRVCSSCNCHRPTYPDITYEGLYVQSIYEPALAVYLTPQIRSQMTQDHPSSD